MATASCPAEIDVIAWSPHGQVIAVAQSDSTISVLDAVTLRQLRTMHPPPGTKVFAFSPDSPLLFCCGVSPDSLEGFVAAWDVRTGGTVGSWETPYRLSGSPSFITSSSGGDAIGVAHTTDLPPNTIEIRIYDIDSRECVYSRSFEGLLAGIWTHGEYLQFAIIVPNENVTVRQAAFAQGHNYNNVADGLDAPPGLNPTRSFLFHPALRMVSYISGDTLNIWDSQNAKYSLCSDDIGFNGSAMSFSPDGRLFACGTIRSGVHLWKDRDGDYVIHRKFTSSVTSPTPLFSPNNGSVVVWNQSTLQLFSLEHPTTPPSADASQASGQGRPFALEFSPGEEYIAFARLGSNKVAVVDHRSRGWRLDIDAGMEVYGLKIHKNTVVVEGDKRVIAWNLPEEGDTSTGGTVTVEASARTVMLKGLENRGPKFTSISPDLLMLAEVWPEYETGTTGSLTIYDTKTGVKIGGAEASCDTPWFSPDGDQVWCGVDVEEVQGWEVVKSNGSPKVELVPLAESPPEGWPWRPSGGRTVTDDGRIFSGEGEQLLLLPPDWISNERGTRMWRGRFLGLLHGSLSEPVILELE